MLAKLKRHTNDIAIVTMINTPFGQAIRRNLSDLSKATKDKPKTSGSKVLYARIVGSGNVSIFATNGFSSVA